MLGLAVLLWSLTPAAAAGEPGDFVKQFDTTYNHLVVHKIGSIVELRSVERQKPHRESAVNLADPDHLVVPYTHGLFYAAAFQPNPRNVLMLGLGGGGFNRAFNRAFPEARLQSVEVDARVKEVATRYMAFQESEKNRVTIMDARMFVKRKPGRYDWIILDAYKGTSVPPHLKTAEFYREVSARLESSGLVIANLQNDSLLFDFDVVTLKSVFPQVLFFQIPGTENVVAIASSKPGDGLRKLAAEFDPERLPVALRRIVSFNAFKGRLFEPVTAKQARVMTDDFAPADYYQVRARPRGAL